MLLREQRPGGISLGHSLGLLGSSVPRASHVPVQHGPACTDMQKEASPRRVGCIWSVLNSNGFHRVNLSGIQQLLSLCTVAAPSLAPAAARGSIQKHRPGRTLPLQASQCCPPSSASAVPTAQDPSGSDLLHWEAPQDQRAWFPKMCSWTSLQCAEARRDGTTDLQEGTKTGSCDPCWYPLCSHLF